MTPEQYDETLAKIRFHEKCVALAASMLLEYADVLGNRVCNDWEFPDGWTEAEKAAFVRAYHEKNGDPENFDPSRLIIHDYSVAWFLGKMLTFPPLA